MVRRKREKLAIIVLIWVLMAAKLAIKGPGIFALKEPR